MGFRGGGITLVVAEAAALPDVGFAGQLVLVEDDGDGKAALYEWNGVAWVKIADPDVASGEAFFGPGVSTDGELPLFDGTGGNALKRSNGLTGLLRVASGVVSAVTTWAETLLSGNVDMAGSKVTNLGSASASGDAVPYGQLQALVSGPDWQESVLARQDAPPVSPSTGDRYIVGTSPSGAWVGSADAVATWTGSAWSYLQPSKGCTVPDETLGRDWLFNGSAWVDFGSSISHAALFNLSWVASGNTGPANAVPTFDGAGDATADAGLGSLAAADAAAGFPYVTAANTWTSLSNPAANQSGSMLAWNGSAPVWASSLFRSLAPIATIIASGTSGEYQRCPFAPSVIRLASPAVFSTIADAKATPPASWAAVNSASMASASADAGGLTFTSTAAAAQVKFRRSWTRGARRSGVVWRMKAAAVANQGAVGFYRYGAVASNPCVGVDFFNNTGTYYIRHWNNGSTTQQVLAVGTMNVGVWFRLLLDGTFYQLDYNDTNTATEPVTWQNLRRETHAPTLSLTDPFTEEFSFQAVAAGACTGTLMYLRDFTGLESGNAVPGTQLNAVGYAATSGAITLAVLDFGMPVLPDTTLLRAFLGAAENGLPGDAATWTYSMTGSSSAAPAAATTYQSSAALVLKQPSSDTTETTPRRYWTLRAICSSSGSVQPGSFDTARVPFIPLA